jgi:hypothetical protein
VVKNKTFADSSSAMIRSFRIFGRQHHKTFTVLPQYWYTESIRTIIQANLSAKDIAYFWQGIRIELLMATALLGLALVVRSQKRIVDV